MMVDFGALCCSAIIIIVKNYGKPHLHSSFRVMVCCGGGGGSVSRRIESSFNRTLKAMCRIDCAVERIAHGRLFSG